MPQIVTNVCDNDGVRSDAPNQDPTQFVWLTFASGAIQTRPVVLCPTCAALVTKALPGLPPFQKSTPIPGTGFAATG